jgi:hypothetical protein
MKNLFISVLTLVSIGASAQVALTNQGMTEYMIEQRLKYVDKPFDSLKLYDVNLCTTIIYDAVQYPGEILCSSVYVPEDLSYSDAFYETSRYKIFIHMPEDLWDYEAGDELGEEYLILYPIK